MKGPQGQKRPADAIGCAVMVAKIATGEITETLKEPSERNLNAIAAAKARAVKLSRKKRKAIAKTAAKARWNKK